MNSFRQTRIRYGTAVLCVLLATLVLSSCGLVLDDERRLDRAQAALADGDYRAAIIDAKTVLLDHPDNARARRLLGSASVAAGDGAGAEKELRRSIDLGTPPGYVIVDLGLALLLQRKFAEITD